MEKAALWPFDNYRVSIQSIADSFCKEDYGKAFAHYLLKYHVWSCSTFLISVLLILFRALFVEQGALNSNLTYSILITLFLSGTTVFRMLHVQNYAKTKLNL